MKNLEGSIFGLLVTLATVLILLWPLKMLKLSDFSQGRRLLSVDTDNTDDTDDKDDEDATYYTDHTDHTDNTDDTDDTEDTE